MGPLLGTVQFYEAPEKNSYTILWYTHPEKHLVKQKNDKPLQNPVKIEALLDF